MTEKLHLRHVEKCPKCGKVGTLVLRAHGSSDRRYYYVRHGDAYCYLGELTLTYKVALGIVKLAGTNNK